MMRKLLMKREGCLPIINRRIGVQRIHRATVASETTMMERIAKRLQMRTKTSLAPLENLKIVKNSTKLLTDPFID
jgi:hypothetical protein